MFLGSKIDNNNITFATHVYGSVIGKTTNFCFLNETSLIKMLNRIGPKIEPYGTPLKMSR